MKLLSLLLTALSAVPAFAAAPYPLAPFERPDTLYTVSVDGVQVDLHRFADVLWVGVEDGKQVVITTRLPRLTQAEVSPKAHKIAVKLDEKQRRCSFAIPGQGHYVVRLDGHRLFLFVGEAPATPAGALAVTDFGADPTGKTVCTAALQRALDQAAEKGRTLCFPAGIYRTGTIRIPSHSRVYLAPGSVIRASDNKADLPDDADRPVRPADSPANANNGEWMTFSRLIWVDGATDIQITGSGVIDGNGAHLRSRGKPANLIRIRNSSDVLISGVVLSNPAAWNTHILHSERITMHNVKILNDPAVANGDGIDPDASRQVEISGCFMYCSDDNVAVKSTNNGGFLRDVQDIRVCDNVLLTRKSSLKVGTETRAANMRGITFENNDVVEADRAMALYCYDGAVFSDIRYVGNRVERNWRDSGRKAIDFGIKNRLGAGRIEGVLIKDCSFAEAFPLSSSLAGLDASHRITGVVFDNVRMEGRKVTNETEARIIRNNFADPVVFK